MPERQPKRRKEVSFGETMNPDIRGIWNDGRYVGILISNGENFAVEWRTKNGSPLRISLRLLEAVVKEKNRIVKERRQEK
jgi:hypothetical protein